MAIGRNHFSAGVACRLAIGFVKPVIVFVAIAIGLSACVSGTSKSSGVEAVLSVDAKKRKDKSTENSSDVKTALKSSKQNTPASVKAVESVTKKKQRGFFARNEASNQKVTAQKKPLQRSAKKTRKSARNRTRRGNALPGVRSKGLFGILSGGSKARDLDGPVEVASVTNMARRGNFGLLLQTPNVKVGCFPRNLVAILKRVERRFGRTPIVTSGYRSRARNRRIRGARNSVHISCKAADIQVRGVSKWKLAKYLRSIPGRGGVGTYCHTKSVHIDVGVRRDWNWRCRRGRRR